GRAQPAGRLSTSPASGRQGAGAHRPSGGLVRAEPGPVNGALSGLRRLLPLALAAAALATPAVAHPHIFIDAKATVVFDDTGAVSEIRHVWSFDEAFSAWSVEGLDADGDGVVTRAEQQELADQDMEGLAQYGYYTFAGEQGGEDLVFEAGQNATRDYVDGHTILQFGIRLAQPYRIQRVMELAIN